MFSTIPQTKFGNCSKCSATNTDIVKIGKDNFCLSCNRDIKNKKQISKANQRSAVRGLRLYQRESGIVDDIQELTIDLDRVVSRYVRLREMGKYGKCQCYTCQRKLDWNRVHAGHFINRVHLQLRWDLTYNLRVQCPTCNITLRGNIAIFKKKLEEEQKGITEWLQDTAREVYSPTRDELKQLLFDYQQKLHTVENKLK